MVSDGGSTAGRELITPKSIYAYSLLLMFIVILPFSIGVSYVLKVGNRLFNGPAEYSVLFGLGLGVVLSIIAAFIYGRVAIKELVE